MIAILFTIALDTTPVKPLPVLLPKPVQSEKTKSNDKAKNSKVDDANRGVMGVSPDRLVAR